MLADGDNCIIVVTGASDHVTPEYVERALPAIERADIVMIQQEIPEDTVDYVSRLCKTLGTPLLLNPAPARPLSKATIENAAYITPNEHEASVLFQGLSREEALQRFPEKLFITEGKNGVRFHNGTEERLIPSFPVKAVDTTGAGDTFNAGLAVALSEGGDIESALRFANRAASLSVLKFGAQGGMPKRAEVERALS